MKPFLISPIVLNSLSHVIAVHWYRWQIFKSEFSKSKQSLIGHTRNTKASVTWLYEVWSESFRMGSAVKQSEQDKPIPTILWLLSNQHKMDFM